MRRDPVVDQIMCAARRHIVAFARSQGVSTIGWKPRQQNDLRVAERNLRQAIRRAVRVLRRHRPSSGDKR